MSVSFNLKGSDWAAKKQQNCSGEEAEYWSKLENYSKKKLWHQMTNVRNLTHNNMDSSRDPSAQHVVRNRVGSVQDKTIWRYPTNSGIKRSNKS